MGYIIAVVLLLIIVPLVMVLLTRRRTGPGGIEAGDHGVTRSQPSSDQPTPPPGPQTDRPSIGGDRGVPPG